MSEAITVALLTVAGGGLGALITIFAQQRKDKVEITQTITETAMSLIEPLKKRIEELETSVQKLTWENSNLRLWAERLVAQVKQLGGEPCEYKDSEGQEPK